MSRWRNVFGDLEFELGAFFVPHRAVNGKYSILKHEPWYVTNASIIYGEGFWETVQPFDSWIQAVRFLKENYNNLI